MQQKQIIIHVGMHKTGTTFLQYDVFPNIPGIYYANPYNQKEPITQLIKRLFSQNPVTIDLQREKQEIEDYINSIKEPIVLISSEKLFGHFYTSYFNNHYMTQVLKELFPHARIFISIRRQDDWFESLYRKVLHKGEALSINTFLNYYDGRFQAWHAGSILRGSVNVRMDFCKFIEYYHQEFSKENVFVLPYELLKSDRPEFLRRFYEFFDLEPYYPQKNTYRNRSYSLTSSYLALLINRLVTSAKTKQRIRLFL